MDSQPNETEKTSTNETPATPTSDSEGGLTESSPTTDMTSHQTTDEKNSPNNTNMENVDGNREASQGMPQGTDQVQGKDTETRNQGTYNEDSPIISCGRYVIPEQEENKSMLPPKEIKRLSDPTKVKQGSQHRRKHKLNRKPKRKNQTPITLKDKRGK